MLPPSETSAWYSSSCHPTAPLPPAPDGAALTACDVEQWSKNRGIQETNFGINSEEEFATVGGFAERMGYQLVGPNYAKRVA